MKVGTKDVGEFVVARSTFIPSGAPAICLEVGTESYTLTTEEAQALLRRLQSALKAKMPGEFR